MSNLVPYEKYDGFDTRLYPTGKCKKRTITYADGNSYTCEYIQCRVKIFGIPLWTRWVNKNYIDWREVKDEIYDCDIKE